MKIQKVFAREILDSRGNPTVEADVVVQNKIYRAAVPSGASTGKYEAIELRDNNQRYLGLGVQKAVENVNTFLAERIVGMHIEDQRIIDDALIEADATKEKSNYGANALLAVSLACTRAGAAQQSSPLYNYLATLSKRKGMQLPVPMLNLINGGKHAGQEHDVQEHMIMPIKATSFSEGLQQSAEIYQTLKKTLKQKYNATATLIGDEGGFVPPLKNVEARLSLLQKIINKLGYEQTFSFALDVAASECYNEKKNNYQLGKKTYTAEKLADYYEQLVSDYNIFSIEDGFAEDDWQAWHNFTQACGKKLQVVGDDLLVTNKKRIAHAASKKACNALLLKVNQIGTVTEALEAATMAFKNKWKVVVSHRSGETEDSFIADLVVGLAAGQAKFGAPARSERTAKYNQLLRIEEELGRKARYGL